MLRSGYVGGSSLVIALALTLAVAAGATYALGLARRRRLDRCLAVHAADLGRVTFFVVLACACGVFAIWP